MRKFVTAFNGNRDEYQLAAALAEEQLLERLVTDYYTPDIVHTILRRLNIPVRRHNEQVPSALVSYSSTALSTRIFQRLRKALAPDWFDADRAIGRKARKIALETNAIPFVYSHHAYWAFEGLEDRPRILFQLHPHPAYCYQLLEDDFARFPSVAWSFRNEQDSIPLEKQKPERTEEWRRATGIICSSSFTKASLVAQGADSRAIKVVPYGAHIAKDVEPLPRGSECRFLFVGQGVQRKGLHHLILAWQRAGLRDASLTVICARIDPGIEAMISGTNITLLPRQSASTLDEHFKRSDIFVMPSLIEGFGLVYLEAVAKGLFVIGTKNTGLPDLNLPEAAASIFEAGDVPALIDALAIARDRWRRGHLDKRFIVSTISGQSWTTFRHSLMTQLRHLVEPVPTDLSGDLK